MPGLCLQTWGTFYSLTLSPSHCRALVLRQDPAGIWGAAWGNAVHRNLDESWLPGAHLQFPYLGREVA